MPPVCSLVAARAGLTTLQVLQLMLQEDLTSVLGDFQYIHDVTAHLCHFYLPPGTVVLARRA